nr:BA14K family protein [Rhodoplanes sp. Z2-YC6860]
MFRTSLTILAAFGCGAVAAAVFVSRPVPAPDDPQPAAAPAPVAAAPPISLAPPPAEEWTSAPDRPQPRVIPLDQSSAQSSTQPPAQARQTTGAGSSESAAGLGQGAASASNGAANSCNQNACARAYHSFDSASCTYQPSRGGPRRQCEK